MEATEEPIEITVAANAGVMIRAGNTVILWMFWRMPVRIPSTGCRILCCLKWLKGESLAERPVS